MATGKLSVQLGSDSMFLGQNVPIEVRDSSMRLVQRSSSGRQLELPAGLYQVSAVLEDGRRHSALVQIKEGEQTPVELAPEPGVEAARSRAATSGSGLPGYERPRYTRGTVAAFEAGIEAEPAVAAEFLEAQGARLQRQTRSSWLFTCDPHIEAVPTARFQIGDHRVEISLPISPAGSTPSGACAVRIDGTRADAWISPERTVANAMQNMLAAGYLLQAAHVAGDAVELLRGKYEDPAGAALGALILHKAGRLQRWQGWVENLARDFGWLPDGKVLLADLLFHDEARQGRALECALQASGQRMLFTESHSLLLDLLRRWPRHADREPRDEAMRRVVSISPYIDWETICLTHSLREDDG